MSKNLVSKWTIAIIIAGLIDIYAILNDLLWLEYIFKPGTMVLIIAFGFIGNKKNPNSISKLILVGLFFGMLGDITLMLKDHLPFVMGLGFFLVCHLLYISAFWKQSSSWGDIRSAVPYMFFYIVAMIFFVPRVGELAIPVAIYISVIVMMGWRARVVYQFRKDSSSLMLVIGSTLFMISDTTLAYNKFIDPIWISGFWIMSTYFAAQYFIARSLHKA